MPTNIIVKVHRGESIEAVLRRFSRRVRNSGLISEVLDHQAHQSPGERRRSKRQQAWQRKEKQERKR